MTQAFGIDISRYNTSADGKKKVDFDVINAHTPKVLYIAARCGISWGYQDPWFEYYWQEMARIKTNRLAYHVEYPGESAQRQADNLFRIVQGDWEHDRIVLDLELDHGYNKYTITKCTNQFLEICRSETGRYPIIYSRAGWVDTHLNTKDLPKVDWWLAQYYYPRPYPFYTPEKPPPPRLPLHVTDWLICQTGEKCKGIGTPGAYYMDHNRWNGGVLPVMEYFGHGEIPTPDPPTPPNNSELIKGKAIEIGTLADEIVSLS